MKIDRLKLRDFRNYSELDLEFPPGVIAFVGANGQGKTNLIEAFHFLLRGESFRPASFDSLRANRLGTAAEALSIQARLSQKALTFDVDLKIHQGRKVLQKNGHRVSAGSLGRTFPLVLFSPESLQAIKSGPEARRELVDDVLVTHSAASVKILREYRKALRARTRVLRDVRDDLMPKAEAIPILESLDPIFLPLATELTLARLQALGDLLEDFKRACLVILDLPSVDISVEYLVSGQNVVGWSRSELLSAMHKRALELRDAELAAGASLVGPHKHDVRFLFAGKDSRFFCSQGQQRALILSFKMAQILYHYKAHQIYPFLLLDDVLSELDPDRRANLVGLLKDIPAQIFLTTTDLSFSTDFGDRRLSIFQIENGTVRAAEGL